MLGAQWRPFDNQLADALRAQNYAGYICVRYEHLKQHYFVRYEDEMIICLQNRAPPPAIRKFMPLSMQLSRS
jgi:hypothetical protein